MEETSSAPLLICYLVPLPLLGPTLAVSLHLSSAIAIAWQPNMPSIHTILVLHLLVVASHSTSRTPSHTLR
jgi:hypothetical protein